MRGNQKRAGEDVPVPRIIDISFTVINMEHQVCSCKGHGLLGLLTVWSFPISALLLHGDMLHYLFNRVDAEHFAKIYEAQ